MLLSGQDLGGAVASGVAAPDVSIVVPCFDEAHRLDSCFEGLDRARRALGVASEVLIVDDGSRDATAEIAEAHAAARADVRVLREPHRGKGGAVRAGVLAARGAWVVMADADWSLDPEDLGALLPPCAPDADVVIASREHTGAHRFDEPEHRHLMGRVFNRLVQVLVLPGVQDSQCGYKAFRQPSARALFEALETVGWAFDVEVIARAQKEGLRIVTVPVAWRWRADSRVRHVRDTLAMSLDVWRIRGRMRRKTPR